ncbi:MAG: folylpolyglutamate synthase/dihydrofolate synthase family protein [Edaphocola sp.]
MAINIYPEALEWLHRKLPMFSNVGQSALKPGLDNIVKLCNLLGNPQNKFPTVHIAGTNGKGSTSHIVAAALQRAGYKTGLYTSPHLVDLRERVRINGAPVTKEFVVEFVNRAIAFLDDIQPSYFELNVAMAFAAFAEAKVDIAVIETGLGGRLDSTNIISPILSVITNIGLDHTQILGDTLAKIAFEKAGIVKHGVPVVVGESQPETEQVFFRKALAENTGIVYADTLWEIVRTQQDMRYQYLKLVDVSGQKMYDAKTDLLGDFQLANIKTGLAACSVLERLGWKTDLAIVIESLASVKSTTGLRGRWEIIPGAPTVILDVAHNPPGLEYLAQNLKNKIGAEGTVKVHIVCGFVSDKDVPSALAYFPKEATYYFTQAQVPRAMPYTQLAAMANELGYKGGEYAAVEPAFQAAIAAAAADDIVLVTGSFFIVGEAIRAMERAEG